MNKNAALLKAYEHGTSQDSSARSPETAGTREPRLRKTFVWYQSLTLLRCEDIKISDTQQERPTVFDAWFSRCRTLLYFIACRVLGSNEGAEDIVQSCWLTGSRNQPKFETEGEFRSWLFRILIDEGLTVLRKKKP